MKKLLAYLCCMGLILSSTLSAQITYRQRLQRLWDCGWDPKKNHCSSEEISRSRKWLISATPAALAALLLAAGITVKAYKVRKAQNARQKERDKQLENLSDQWKKLNNEVQKIVTEMARLQQLPQTIDIEMDIAEKNLAKETLEMQKKDIARQMKEIQDQK